MSQPTRGIAPWESAILKYTSLLGRRYPHGTAVVHLLTGVLLFGLGVGLVGYGYPWGWVIVAVAGLHFWLGYLWEMSTRR